MNNKIGHPNKGVQVLVYRRGILSIAISAALLLPLSSVYAKVAVPSEAKSTLSQNYIVEIDGVIQSFTQPPVSMYNTTMVPMRSIFEKLGANIKFDAKTQLITATKQNITIKHTVGTDIATVNGMMVILNVKSLTINNTTMIPLRFVAEAFGATVGFNSTTLTVTISGDEAAIILPRAGAGYAYGFHDYGSDNFQQYTAVMQIIGAAKETYPLMKLDGGGRYEAMYKAYLTGDRASKYAEDTLESHGLTQAENDLSALIDNGVSASKAEEAYKIGRIAAILVKGLYDPRDGTPSSAYDALVLKKSDCDSDANVFSAVFDSFGYNTAIIARTDHADMVVQIEGKWYTVVAGSFEELPVTNLAANNLYVYTQPTTGSFN